jgi:hypothetical protein
MKKEFREILKNSPITVKCKNFGSWIKEDIINLLEAAESRRIKVTGTADNLTIIFNNNYLKIVRKTNSGSLEKDMLMILEMFYLYMGYKTKISSSFGTEIIN